MDFNRGRHNWQMLELPGGITTSNGNWYHITREGIESYVPGLLKKYTLERIIKEADAWVKSSDGLSLVLYFVLVYASVDPLIATLITFVFYFGWYFNTSVFVNLSTTKLFQLLSKDGFVYTVSAVLLIGISFNEAIASYGLSVDFSALWYGIALFFLFKVGLLGLGIQFIRNKFFGKPKVSKEDRILNMLLIRYGIKTGKLTGNVEKMENDLIRVINYHKEKRNKE